MTIPFSPYVAAHRLGEQRVEEVRSAAARRQMIDQASGKQPRLRRPDRRMVLDHWVAHLLVWIMLLLVAVGAGVGVASGSLWS